MTLAKPGDRVVLRARFLRPMIFATSPACSQRKCSTRWSRCCRRRSSGDALIAIAAGIEAATSRVPGAPQSAVHARKGCQAPTPPLRPVIGTHRADMSVEGRLVIGARPNGASTFVAGRHAEPLADPVRRHVNSGMFSIAIRAVASPLRSSTCRGAVTVDSQRALTSAGVPASKSSLSSASVAFSRAARATSERAWMRGPSHPRPLPPHPSQRALIPRGYRDPGLSSPSRAGCAQSQSRCRASQTDSEARRRPRKK